MSAGGQSGARLGRVHDAIVDDVERGEVPGLVTLVARRGEVHADTVGAKAVGGDPMRRDTISQGPQASRRAMWMCPSATCCRWAGRRRRTGCSKGSTPPGRSF
ncbi:MAG: hypothetical protein AVDCRST_MAG28-452 [uncultured Rubrobacteraceae bacterium]|uniref:Beta-lactamase class C-like and penicillin binding proteins (PBPs) superfamily n=1 Tax=uncultured Rubrobacteraceae bacterium TaxID=349277 RepID=A0A6J4QEG1_9ACTN|nr:MAG: hypothetical protein AVDCRST_MAG28-452 [uncultured Rubrobacteraceae bacterium]